MGCLIHFEPQIHFDYKIILIQVSIYQYNKELIKIIFIWLIVCNYREKQKILKQTI